MAARCCSGSQRHGNPKSSILHLRQCSFSSLPGVWIQVPTSFSILTVSTAVNAYLLYSVFTRAEAGLGSHTEVCTWGPQSPSPVRTGVCVRVGDCAENEQCSCLPSLPPSHVPSSFFPSPPSIYPSILTSRPHPSAFPRPTPTEQL